MSMFTRFPEFSEQTRRRTEEVLDQLEFDEQGKRLLWRMAELWGVPPLQLIGHYSLSHVMSIAAYQSIADLHEDWKWPLWMRRGMDPDDPAYKYKGGLNQEHRHWTAVGFPFFNVETYVGECGEITPADRNMKNGWISPENRFALTFWVYDIEKQSLVAVGEEGEVEQTLRKDWVPIVDTRWRYDGLALEQEVCAADVAGFNSCLVRATLKNEAEKTMSMILFVCIRPMGAVHFSPIFDLKYDPAGQCFTVQGHLALVLCSRPESVSCHNLEQMDVCVDAGKGRLDGSTQAQDELGYCTGAAAYRCELSAGESFSLTVAVPADGPDPLPTTTSVLQAADFDEHAGKVEPFWSKILEEGAQLTVADANTKSLYRTSLINLYTMRDGRQITPGPGVYHGFWVRDAGMFTNALDKWGHHETAEQCLNIFPEVQQPDGYFYEAPVLYWKAREWDFNGIAIWALFEHFLLTRKTEWLRDVYPSMKKGVEFLSRLREVTKRDDPKAFHYGLLTPSRSEEAWAMTMDYFYWDDFWAIRAMRYVEEAAQLLGYDEDADWVAAERADLESCTWQSIDRVMAARGFDFIPVSPYRGLDSTIIGSIAALYPCRIVAADDARIVGTQHTMLDRFMRDGLYFLRVVYGTLTALHTCSVAHAAVYMDDSATAVRVFRDIERWSSSTHCWPEGNSVKTGQGAQGDMPQNYAGAEYLLLLRDMLLYEDGDRVKLTPSIPTEWVAPGKQLAFERAPTFFGEMGFRINADNTGKQVTLELTPPAREPQEGYRWFIRDPKGRRVRRVSIDGARHEGFSENCVEVPTGSRVVVAEF
jgi:hypothetical protein